MSRAADDEVIIVVIITAEAEREGERGREGTNLLATLYWSISTATCVRHVMYIYVCMYVCMYV